MTRALFYTQLNEVEAILKRLDLLKLRLKPTYMNYGLATIKNKSYREVWELCNTENKYDFKLSDESLLQYCLESASPLKFTYSYYECPFKPIISLEEYLQQEELQQKEEYDQYRAIREYDFLMPELKGSVTPLRYDYDTSMYLAGSHPASHIHFGYDCDIRVATKNILRPISFMLFMIRQYYPDKWTELISEEGFSIISRNVRESLDAVDLAYFNKIDLSEMHFV